MIIIIFLASSIFAPSEDGFDNDHYDNLKEEERLEYLKENYDSSDQGSVDAAKEFFSSKESSKNIRENKEFAQRFLKDHFGFEIDLGYIDESSGSIYLEEGILYNPPGTKMILGDFKKVIAKEQGGFSYVLEDGKEIDIKGEKESQISYDKEKGFIIKTEKGESIIKEAKSIDLNGDKIAIELEKGQKIRSDKPISYDGETLKFQKYSNWGISLDGKTCGSGKSASDTTLKFVGKGFELEGDFIYTFDADFKDLKGNIIKGKVAVPSMEEYIAKKQGAFDEKNKKLTFCFNCPDKNKDKTISWNNNKIRVNGEISASITALKGSKIFHVTGLIEGSSTEFDIFGSKVVKMPSDKTLISVNKKELDKKISSLVKIKGKLEGEKKALIKKESFWGDTYHDPIKGPKEKERIEKTIAFIEEKQEEYNKLRKNPERYGLAKIANIVATDGNKLINAIYTRDLEKKETKIYFNKANFFTAHMLDEGSINYEFEDNDKKIAQVLDNVLYDTKGNKLPFYTDTKINLDEQGKGDNKKLILNVNSDISEIAKEICVKKDVFYAGEFVGGFAQEALKGKFVNVLQLSVDKDKITIKSDLEELRKEKLKVTVIGIEKDLTGRITNIAQESVKEKLEEQIATAGEKELEVMEEVISKLRENNLIDTSLEAELKRAGGEMLQLLKQKDYFKNIEKFQGSDIEIKKDSDGNFVVSAVFYVENEDEKKQKITLPAIKLKSDNPNLIQDLLKRFENTRKSNSVKKAMDEIYKQAIKD